MQTECKPMKTLWILFSSMLYISAFTFGGGFVIVTLMKKRFVDQLHWLDEEEMLDMTALAQSAPGPIAVNAAILAGRKIGGFAGMLAAVLGTIIPPVVILSVVSFFYTRFAQNAHVAALLRGMQAGVAAVIADVVISLGAKALRGGWLHGLIMALAFVATFFLNVNVVWVILGAAALGVGKLLWQKRRRVA